ncbi:MFS general substrate transporter [Sodiomyces alkalinus F11]|uniref:MFS general substrate transporter n=1 Tax=Sodiomyces alkalinus (strain CBS 110278 / VKM F-3762 / F11) TaxID=1314773 RepID=A0A3N2PX29_SODAK|nr:MFS general substrate transporter [Sodiomyces alkalinus F11]ROT39089.1 MFS general substrate transporter [Sodiomyces alkalinus F11]
MSDSDNEVVGYETTSDELPKGYFRSRFFIGTMLATGVGLWAGTAAFAYAAPILTQINQDLGPDPRYTWISLVYNAALAVCLAPVGRLSDIFGRRYYFIGGALLAVIGSIICATATSIPALIGGNVFLGVASATQLSFHFVVGELLPMKYRYVGNGLMYFFAVAGSGVGPSVAYAFIDRHPSVGWRGVYWFLLAINALGLALWTLFYFPPTFQKKHQSDGEDKSSIWYWVRQFDYVGTFLACAGLVVFLLGLSWGGAVYPWASAATISTIVIGFLTLVAFVLWEIYAPIKEPLVPMHLFKNTEWVAAIVLLGLGAGVYYAFAIIWPMQVAVMYNTDGDIHKMGAIANIIGLAMTGGQITGGLLAAKIGKTKYQCMIVFLIGGVFMGCASIVTRPEDKAAAIALVTLGCFWVGWNESICLSNATICVHDQREIGVAGGMAGSLRAAICGVLLAIYTVILSNRLTENIPKYVPAALLEAGLPESSVADFMGGLALGSFEGVVGATESVIAAGMRAYQEANAKAFQTVYLTTIAFSVIAVGLTWFAPNTEKYMTEKVVATLGSDNNNTALVSEKKHSEV